jgi:membrane protein
VPDAVRHTPVPVASVGGWRAVLTRIGRRISADNAVLLAAGVAFFGIFAVFPTVVAVVSVYGLVSDPADVTEQVADLTEALPEPTRDFLLDQANAVVATGSTELGVALVLAIAVALWSASSGVRHLMESIRAAYGEPRQSFVRLRAQALLLAVAGVVFLAVLVAALTVVPTILRRVAPDATWLSSYVRWPVIAALMVAALGVLYRIAPSRDTPRRRWWSLGGVVGTALWLVSSVGLAVYSALLADIEASYGSFGAVLVTMVWLWLSALSVLVGAYLNDETEQPATGAGASRSG